jgi:hypothetical protein
MIEAKQRNDETHDMTSTTTHGLPPLVAIIITIIIIIITKAFNHHCGETPSHEMFRRSEPHSKKGGGLTAKHFCPTQ